MKKIVYTALLVGMCNVSMAQHTMVQVQATDKLIKEQSGITPQSIEGTFIGFSNPVSDDLLWLPQLTKVSANESENDELVQQIKEEKNKVKDMSAGSPRAEARTTTVVAPIIGNNFAGIDNGGTSTPLDNTIAISNKDTIVAFVNSQVAYYTTSGTVAYSKSLYYLIGSGSSGVTNNLCDPKVLFDNVSKRFIFYVQVCDKVPANSKVVLGFSKSSNPMDGWYIYKFSGNPLSDNSFWDYPKMGISNDEVFVTGNLFHADGSFNQAVILQVQKSPCYSGTTLTTSNSKLYSGISGGGIGSIPPFTLLPVSYGQSGSYGPGIYLVSTMGSVSGADHYRLYHITNNIASGPALNGYDVSISPNYSVAGDAAQLGTTRKLNTGDCRSMEGFYLNGTIHFVFGKDGGGGYAGISYNRLKVSTLTNTTSTFTSSTSDFTYPAIVSASDDSLDKSVLIAYNESNSSIYPGTRVVSCDQNMNWSAGVHAKDGASYVYYGPSSDPTDRWGDYTGLCKKYGDTAGHAWMAGMYGNSGHIWQQWISEIKPHITVGVPAVTQEQATAKVYPNPIIDNYHVKFTVPERQNIIINITDMEGRTVVELYHNIAEQGENIFSFNKANLSPGIYSLNIIGETNNIRNERIIIAGK
jgi:hypothetical protein